VAEEGLSGYSNLIPCIVPIGKLSESRYFCENVRFSGGVVHVRSHSPSSVTRSPRVNLD
jgi:hypothetical protein